MGDFNATVVGEGRYNAAHGLRHAATEFLSKRVDKALGALTELCQEAFTHRAATKDGKIISLRRSDRIYINWPPHELADRCAQGGVWAKAEDLSFCSDHVPVWASVSVPSTMGAVPSIPRWVIKHPSFPKLVEKIFTAGMDEVPVSGSSTSSGSPNGSTWQGSFSAPDTQGSASHCTATDGTRSTSSPMDGYSCDTTYDPIEDTIALKQCMHEAAKVLKAQLTQEDMQDHSKRLHVLLKFWRLIRDRKSSIVEAMAKKYHLLRDYIIDSSMGIFRFSKLEHDIGECFNANTVQELEELEAEVSTKEAKKSARRAALLRRQRQWRTGTRRIFLTGILDDHGLPLPTDEDAADALHSHWQGVFSKKPIARSALRKLRQHIVKIDQDIDHELAFEEFSEMVDQVKDSGVGPDGVAYSAWQALGSLGKHVLYRLYLHFFHRIEPDPDLQLGRFAFLPKGDDDTDAGGALRTPACTRPLQLANTDVKFASKALNVPLARAAGKVCHSQQRGFIAGRNLVDNILDVEAKAISHILRNHSTSGILLLDQKAAFPSLSHTWLFVALAGMGFSPPVLRVVRNHYTNVEVIVVLNGRGFKTISIQSGIKQGDPSSGSLWALAFDPIIRYMIQELPISRLAAYADDVALVAACIVALLVALCPVALVIKGGTSLEINFPKCIAIPGHPRGVDLVREGISGIIMDVSLDGFSLADTIHIVDAVKLIKVQKFGKYLGVMVGPEAMEHQWDGPKAKHCERLALIAGLGLAPIASMSTYNTYVKPVLGHVSQFAALPPELLQREAHLLSKIFSSPASAFPMELIQQMKTVGISVQYTKLEHFSMASRYRAAVNSLRFHEVASEIQAVIDSDDCLSVPPLAWFNTSCFSSMRQAVQQVQTICPSMPYDCPYIQRLCIKSLKEATLDIGQMHRQIVRRVRLLRVTSLEQVASMTEKLPRVSKSVPQYIVLTFIRSWCNGWCTASRMGQRADCPFCGLDGGHDLLQFTSCQNLRDAIVAMVPQPMVCQWPAREGIHSWLGIGESAAALCTLCLLHDLVHCSMLDAKHGTNQSSLRSILMARRRQVIRRAPMLQAFLVR